MKSSSKKHIYFLALTLIAIFMLSTSVNLLMNSTVWGNTGSMRSGTFVNTSQGVNYSGWHFYADEANGHSTFIANLNQVNLDNISLKSRVLSGEMMFVIIQGNTHLTFNLSDFEVEMTANDINVSMLEPGRIEMRLYFINALNVHVFMNWY